MVRRAFQIGRDLCDHSGHLDRRRHMMTEEDQHARLSVARRTPTDERTLRTACKSLRNDRGDWLAAEHRKRSPPLIRWSNIRSQLGGRFPVATGEPQTRKLSAQLMRIDSQPAAKEPLSTRATQKCGRPTPLLRSSRGLQLLARSYRLGHARARRHSWPRQVRTSPRGS